MRITPVTYFNTNNNHIAKRKPIFTAHPDFYKYNSTVSCYFRRGAVLLSCSKGYSEIETFLCKIFNANINSPKSLLIAGIGKSQEPFSYLASIKGIIKDNSLMQNVDLYTVDLQSKPEHIELKRNAFCDLLDYQTFPKYAGSSFVKDSVRNWLEIKQEKEKLNHIEKYLYFIMNNKNKWDELRQKGYNAETIYKILEAEEVKEKQKSLHWRVNDEIFEFLEKTYNNPQKSKWDSRIQEAILDYPDNKFDVISANNILPYIQSEIETVQTVEHMERTLKPNGYLITDPYEHVYHVKEIGVSGNMKKVGAGIYQKG